MSSSLGNWRFRKGRFYRNVPPQVAERRLFDHPWSKSSPWNIPIWVSLVGVAGDPLGDHYIRTTHEMRSSGPHQVSMFLTYFCVGPSI